MAEDNDLEVGFHVETEGLISGIEEAKAAIEGLSEPIKSVIDAFGELAEAALAAFAVEKIADFASEMAELGEFTERTSKILGVSTEQVGELSVIAKATGIDVGTMISAMERFQISLAKAATGIGPVAAAFKALGLNANELRAANPAEQLEKVSEAVSKFKDSQSKTADVALLSRGFVQMLPTLDEGKKGMEELREEAEKTNTELSGPMAEALDQLSTKMSLMGDAIKGDFIQSFAAFIPLVTNVVDYIKEMAEDFSNAVKSGGALSITLKIIAATFTDLFIGVETVIAALRILWTIGVGAATVVWDAFAGLTRTITAMFVDLGTQSKAFYTAIEEAALAAVSLIGTDFGNMGRVIGAVFKDLGNLIPGFFTALLDAAKIALSAMAQEFSDLGSGIEKFLTLDFSGAKASFASVSTDAAEAAGKIKGAFSQLGGFEKTDEALKKMSADGVDGAGKVAAAFSEIGKKADFSETEKQWKKANDDIETTTKETINTVKNTSKEYLDDVKKALGIGQKPKGTGEDDKNKPTAPNVDLNNAKGKDTSVGDAMAQSQAEIDIYKRTADAREQLLNEQLKTHQIGEAQWLAQTQDALNDERQDVEDTYARELEIVGLTTRQIIEIKRKEANDLAEIDKKIFAAQAKSAEDATKSWDDAMKSINSAFDSQISGLLKGTTTWAQAFKNVLADLTTQLIKFFVNWGLKQVENYALSIAQNNGWVASTIAGQEAVTTAKVAGDSVTAASGLTSVLTALKNDAAQVFGGVFAFLSPVMGPAAAGPAAASAATVIGGIGMMDIGAYNLPEDQLAMVHKNELVMPASQANAFRSMLESAAAPGGSNASKSGGMPDVHLHMHGIADGDSARQFFNKNSKEMTKALHGALTRGDHLGLKGLGQRR